MMPPQSQLRSDEMQSIAGLSRNRRISVKGRLRSKRKLRWPCQERFLPKFILSLAEGVEMTIEFSFGLGARNIPTFNCGFAALGSLRQCREFESCYFELLCSGFFVGCANFLAVLLRR